MSYIARRLAGRLKNLAEFFPVVVLTGARQTGKTTLLRATFPQHHYVSLDLPSEAVSAEADPDGFLRRHPPPILVDEVQYAPGLFRHVKAAVDADRARRCGDATLRCTHGRIRRGARAQPSDRVPDAGALSVAGGLPGGQRDGVDRERILRGARCTESDALPPSTRAMHLFRAPPPRFRLPRARLARQHRVQELPQGKLSHCE
ncbi:MAG: AAA family ATPase [Myxococcota bacterium]|jgi:hypothetical protein